MMVSNRWPPGQNVVLRSKAEQKGIRNYNYHQAMGANQQCRKSEVTTFVNLQMFDRV